MGRKRKAQPHLIRETQPQSYNSSYDGDYRQAYGHDYGQDYSQGYSQHYSKDYNQDHCLDTGAHLKPSSPAQAPVSFSMRKHTNTPANANTLLRPEPEAKNVFESRSCRDHGEVSIKPESNVEAELTNVIIKTEGQEDSVSGLESEEEDGGVMLHDVKRERGGVYKYEEDEKQSKEKNGRYSKEQEETPYKDREEKEEEVEEKKYPRYKQEEKKGYSKYKEKEEDKKQYNYEQWEEEKRFNEFKQEEEEGLVADADQYYRHYGGKDSLELGSNTNDFSEKMKDEEHDLAEYTPYERERSLEGSYRHGIVKHEESSEEGHGRGIYMPHKYDAKGDGTYERPSDTLYKHPTQQRGSPTARKDWRYKDPKNPDGSCKPMWQDRKATKQEKKDARARLPSALGEIIEKAGGGPRKKVTKTTEFNDLVTAMEDRLRERAKDPDADHKKDDVDLNFADFLEKHGRHRLMSEKLERQALLKANKRICLEKKEQKKGNQRSSGTQWEVKYYDRK